MKTSINMKIARLEYKVAQMEKQASVREYLSTLTDKTKKPLSIIKSTIEDSGIPPNKIAQYFVESKNKPELKAIMKVTRSSDPKKQLKKLALIYKHREEALKIVLEGNLKKASLISAVPAFILKTVSYIAGFLATSNLHLALGLITFLTIAGMIHVGGVIILDIVDNVIWSGLTKIKDNIFGIPKKYKEKILKAFDSFLVWLFIKVPKALVLIIISPFKFIYLAGKKFLEWDAKQSEKER